MSSLVDRLFPTVNDWVLGPAVDPVRQGVVSKASGRVLELGAGSGLNFRFYAPGTQVEAIEPGSGMRQRAEERARAPGVHADIRVQHGKARSLPFDAGSFDAVVTTFVLCSVPDVGQALAEVRRVLKPGGLLLLAEHVLDADPSVARWQRLIQPAWGLALGGCHVDRNIHDAVARAEFDVTGMEAFHLPFPRIARAGTRGVARKL